jgi:polyhydroxyalkanoate synthesis repressor PhaR
MARLVKRYSNRKLYDTSESRYVTLEEISRWVKAGEEVKILENETGEDLTAVTFAQIILEEERKKTGLLSLRLMRDLIQHGEAALAQLAARVESGMEAIRTAPERAGRRLQELTQVSERLAEMQKTIDEVVKRAADAVIANPTFQQQLKRVEKTARALEARLWRLRGTEPPPAGPPTAEEPPPPVEPPPPPPAESGGV